MCLAAFLFPLARATKETEHMSDLSKAGCKTVGTGSRRRCMCGGKFAKKARCK